MSFAKTLLASSTIGLACAVLATVPPVPIAWADNIVAAPSLDPASEGAFRHLRALQDIAVASGGNRAAGTIGYDRSAQYVAEKLREAGYIVHFEEFEFPFFEERAPPVLLVNAPDGKAEPTPAVRTLGNSGAGDVTARLRPVNLQLGDGTPAASASGCDAADFKDFERGAVALIRRGTCQFQAKVEHATAAGAAGVIIMNEGTDGRIDNFSGQLGKPAAIPVVGVSYEIGRSLDATARGNGTVHVTVDAVTGKRSTRNVLADTGAGRDGRLVMVGAHLDSVPEGPGINDNGSGSAAVLEAALQVAKQLSAAGSRVRFAFWGAEENGLVGSRHHVAALSDAERGQIALYINLDMVGSTNYVRYVQSSAASAEGLPATVRHELVTEFAEHKLPVEERSGGRYGSDDAAFSQKGVPTVGLYTGAGAPKSEAQAGTFGGTAGRPFDACYHKACDTIDNIDRAVLEQNTRALVRSLRAIAIGERALGTSAPQAVGGPEPRL